MFLIIFKILISKQKAFFKIISTHKYQNRKHFSKTNKKSRKNSKRQRVFRQIPGVIPSDKK